MTKTWLRVQNNIYRMRKIALLSDADFRAWIYLLCLASERDGNGVLPEIEDVAFALRLGSDDEAVALIERLVERDLIDRKPGGKRGVNFVMHDWDQWQYISNTSGENVPKVSSRTRATTDSDYIQTHNQTQNARARAQGGDRDDQNREERSPQRPIAEQIEPPVRPVNGNGLDHQTEESSAPADPDQQAKDVEFFNTKVWKVYSEIGDPRSSKRKAREEFLKISPDERWDAAVGLVLWRLSMTSKDFKMPEGSKIKFLDNWLAEEEWREFSLEDSPQMQRLVNFALVDEPQS